MHIHIHTILHYVRHLGGLRLVGTLLLMLLVGLLQFASPEPATAPRPARTDNGHIATERFLYGITGSMRSESAPRDVRGTSVPAASGAAPALSVTDPTDPIPPVALYTEGHISVFSRLRPGLFRVPRMNRTPKPKSVYRNVARAPGISFS